MDNPKLPSPRFHSQSQNLKHSNLQEKHHSLDIGALNTNHKEVKIMDEPISGI